MTRKCVLCKETNYKNTYSFFSAPKDPETRKKWQAAIAIDNYAVTDDTYVCSKHFHKNDIITHWVSGIPPHVITIKYKKCRLRPGAVPGRNYHTETDIQSPEKDNSEVYEVNTNGFLNFKKDQRRGSKSFSIPREEESSSTLVKNEETCDIKDYDYVENDNSQSAVVQLSKDVLGEYVLMYTSKKGDLKFCDWMCKTSGVNEQDHCKPKVSFVTAEDDIDLNIANSKESNGTEHFSRMSDLSGDDDTSADQWERKTFSGQKFVDNTLKTIEDLYIENQLPDTLTSESFTKNDYTVYYESNESEMLFEDLLEICTEVALPRGWSCMVTSKGHSTTVVYLYMGMTKNGMPFVEKQVFVKSDMILRCSATNREVNPLMHNLIRDGKHLKVQNLLDVEELIDEFDQRTVCEGICGNEGMQEMKAPKIAYKDGIKWRHISCPLIVNSDSNRCSRCSTLSLMLTRKSKKLLSIPYNTVIFLKEQRKLHTMQQMQRRLKDRDRRYEFIKVRRK